MFLIAFLFYPLRSNKVLDNQQMKLSSICFFKLSIDMSEFVFVYDSVSIFGLKLFAVECSCVFVPFVVDSMRLRRKTSVRIQVASTMF